MAVILASFFLKPTMTPPRAIHQHIGWLLHVQVPQQHDLGPHLPQAA